jgi:hypothetical protein
LETYVTYSATKRFFQAVTFFSALLMALPNWAQPATTRPGRTGKSEKPANDKTAAGKKDAATQQGADKWIAEGISKKEWKTRKRERQREDMLKRIEKRAEGGATPIPSPTPTRFVAGPYQVAEDFDRNVSWEQNGNRGANSNAGYGYSSTNNVAAGCAPGEIGGSVSNNDISWFADNVAGGSVLLDVNAPLNASGWCKFTATGGNASLGWFNADTYTASDTVPDNFLGWRQGGAAIRAALGTTGSSFVDGAPIPFATGKSFQWTLNYLPTGGANDYGQITLTVGGSSSTLSLTKAQRDALSANKFNRFGIVAAKTGREASTLWLDNLVYTKVAGFPLPHAGALAHTRTAFFDTDPTDSTFFAVNNLSPHQPVTVIQEPSAPRTTAMITAIRRFTSPTNYARKAGFRLPTPRATSFISVGRARRRKAGTNRARSR